MVWSKDLIPGTEMNSSPLVSCLDKNDNRMFVTIRTYPKGSFSNAEGDIVLLEIDNKGNILREVLLNDESGNTIRIDGVSVAMGFAMESDNDGNLFMAGKSFTQNREARYRTIISTETATDPNVLQISFLRDYSIQKMIAWSDGTFIANGRSEERRVG